MPTYKQTSQTWAPAALSLKPPIPHLTAIDGGTSILQSNLRTLNHLISFAESQLHH